MKLPVLNLGDHCVAINHNLAVQSIEATCSKGYKKYLIPNNTKLQVVDFTKILVSLVGVNDNGILKYVYAVDIKKYETHIKRMRLVLYCLQENSIHVFVCKNTESDVFPPYLHSKLDLADEVLRGKWEFPVHDMTNHSDISLNIMEMIHKFTGIYGTRHSKDIFDIKSEQNVGEEKIVFVEFKGNAELFKELFGEAPTKKDPFDVLKTTKGKVKAFSTFTSLQVVEYQKNRKENKNQNFFTNTTLHILQSLFQANNQLSQITSDLILQDTEGVDSEDDTKRLTLADINLTEGEVSYKNKYLKYKQKYLNLKNSMGGDVGSSLIEPSLRKQSLREPSLRKVMKEISTTEASKNLNFNIKIDHISNIIPFISEIYAYDSNNNLVILPNGKKVEIIKFDNFNDHTVKVRIDGRQYTISFYNLETFHHNKLIDECA
jgi:hypothetical protein